MVMFCLAAGNARVGRALDNPLLPTEGLVTLIDGLLATAVHVGLILMATPRWAGGWPTRSPAWADVPRGRRGTAALTH